MASGKRLVVVVDKNAVGVAEMVGTLRALADPVFLVADTPEGRTTAPILRALKATSFPLPGGPIEQADLPDEVLAADGVVTFSDRMVRVTAALAQRLGTPGHTPETAELLTDKHRQRRRLAEAGVDDVPSIQVSSVAELRSAVAEIGVPVVVKPVRGEGSLATYLLRDAERAEQVFAAAAREYGGAPSADGDGAVGPFVVERLLAGADFTPLGDFLSVELVASRGEIAVAGVTGKLPQLRPFRECGQLRPHGLPADVAEAATRLAVRAAEACGVTDGVLHIEVKLTPDGPHLIELNGRLGGFVNEVTKRASGLDLVLLAGQVALGEPVRVEASEPDGVVFQWFTNPPLGARRLLAVGGVAKARAHPAVDSYTSLVPARSPCVDSVGSQLLDMLCGRAPSHAELVEVLESVLRELSYTFESAGGERLTMRGDELRRLNLAAPEPTGLPAEAGR